MEFVHQLHATGDTIAAIATPPGEGAVAIIRLSGKDALSIAEKVLSEKIKSYPSHTAHLGKMKTLEGEIIDEVLIIAMHSPRSYTGEDIVEIQCHGGTLLAKRALTAVLSAGARPAAAGEFTLRAFLNGKLDLAQAEAVQNLICAKNELALKAANDHLEGALSKRVKNFQISLTDLGAVLEAWVDFPEEGLEFMSFEELLLSLEKIEAQMQKLLSTFEEGKMMHEGFSLCLIGTPNVGKSSLMNLLLGKERAIVTDIPGTTRDFLEEDFQFADLHFRLIDTAGLRESSEEIEQEGIRRSKIAMERADLILLVLDASRDLNSEESALLQGLYQHKMLIVWNKIDLIPHSPLPHLENLPQCYVSAKEGLGIEELKNALRRLIWKKGAPSKEELVIASLRHKKALEDALLNVRRVASGLKEKISPEYLTIDLKKALSDLGTIIGTNVTEDILSAIFSKFCVGK